MVDQEQDIIQCVRTLKEGGIILYPTDTVWGIGCDATNVAAVEKVYELKKRTDKKSLIVLVADQRDILNYVAFPDPAVFEHLKKTHKPTTVIYEGALGLAPNLVPDDGTIAIRICNDGFCRQLIKRFRKPIVSTSANISGDPTPGNFSEIPAVIINQVDYVVKYRQNDESMNTASAIIKWKKDGTFIVLR